MKAKPKSVPRWVAREIRITWNLAKNTGSQMDAYRILERMVDRLGYGRSENNPSLAVETEDTK